MSQPTPATTAVPPKIPTGREIFDAIMRHIEPELTSEGVKTLAETYKNETIVDYAKRRERYALAFERYKQAYQGYVATLDAQVTRYCRDSFVEVEMDDRSSESGILSNLVSSMQAA